jgi:hypothetical protein
MDGLGSLKPVLNKIPPQLPTLPQSFYFCKLTAFVEDCSANMFKNCSNLNMMMATSRRFYEAHDLRDHPVDGNLPSYSCQERETATEQRD